MFLCFKTSQWCWRGRNPHNAHINTMLVGFKVEWKYHKEFSIAIKLSTPFNWFFRARNTCINFCRNLVSPPNQKWGLRNNFVQCLNGCMVPKSENIKILCLMIRLLLIETYPSKAGVKRELSTCACFRARRLKWGRILIPRPEWHTP